VNTELSSSPATIPTEPTEPVNPSPTPAEVVPPVEPEVPAAASPVVVPETPQMLPMLQSMQRGLQNVQQELANLRTVSAKDPNSDKVAQRRAKLIAEAQKLDSLVEQVDSLNAEFMDETTKGVFKTLVAGVAGMQQVLTDVQSENQQLRQGLQQQARQGQTETVWSQIAQQHPKLDLAKAQAAFGTEYESLRNTLQDEATALRVASHNWETHILPGLLASTPSANPPAPVAPAGTTAKPTPKPTPGGASILGRGTPPPAPTDPVEDLRSGRLKLV
jgi:hypothetical protein